MSHKCAKPGCQFRLPNTYPLPLCPWHAAPGKGATKIVTAAVTLIVGVGGRYAYEKIRDVLNRRNTEAEQKKWREQATQPQATHTNNQSDKPEAPNKVA